MNADLPVGPASAGHSFESKRLNVSETADLIIRGGTIVDGTGAEPFTGDVAISGGRITAVGERSARAGARRSTRAACWSRRASSTSTRTTTARSTWEPPGAVVLARRHHRAARQLRRRLRALPPGGPRAAGRSSWKASRTCPRWCSPGAAVELGELPRVSRRAGCAAATTSTSPPRFRTRRCASSRWASARWTREAANAGDCALMARLAGEAIDAGALGFAHLAHDQPPRQRRHPRAHADRGRGRAREHRARRWARGGAACCSWSRDFTDLDTEFADAAPRGASARAGRCRCP